MPRPQIHTSFEPDKYERLCFIAKKLHLTPQQFVRQAVDQELLKYNVFTLAGGILPDAGIQEVQDEDHCGVRD